MVVDMKLILVGCWCLSTALAFPHLPTPAPLNSLEPSASVPASSESPSFQPSAAAVVPNPTSNPVLPPTLTPVEAPTSKPLELPTMMPIEAPTKSPVMAPVPPPVNMPTEYSPVSILTPQSTTYAYDLKMIVSWRIGGTDVLQTCGLVDIYLYQDVNGGGLTEVALLDSQYPCVYPITYFPWTPSTTTPDNGDDAYGPSIVGNDYSIRIMCNSITDSNYSPLFDISLTSMPTIVPTPLPSPRPTSQPTPLPTKKPTPAPSELPTALPTISLLPSHAPTAFPTIPPIPAPTSVPVPAPSPLPTFFPSAEPTYVPSPAPSSSPSESPTHVPIPHPTGVPSIPPTGSPSLPPTPAPSGTPSLQPSPYPTTVPIPAPTPKPSYIPTPHPATPSPSSFPSSLPSHLPSPQPTAPSPRPTSIPSPPPSHSYSPTHQPSRLPTPNPVPVPTIPPTHSQAPTFSPNAKPVSMWLTTTAEVGYGLALALILCMVIGCVAVKRRREIYEADSWEDEPYSASSFIEDVITCPCAVYVWLSDCEYDARRKKNKGGFKGDYLGDPAGFLDGDPTSTHSNQPISSPLIDPRLDNSF